MHIALATAMEAYSSVQPSLNGNDPVGSKVVYHTIEPV